MRALLILTFISVAILGCKPTQQPEEKTNTANEISQAVQQTESQRLNEWFELQYEEELNFSPITLTMQGRKDRYSEIDDFSEAAADKQIAWKAASVATMKAEFNYDALNDETKTSWDLWDYQYQNDLKGKEFRDQGYVFHQMGGIHSFIPTFLINFHKVENLVDMRAYISRLQQSARGIDQLIVLAEQGAAAGVHAPRFAYEIVTDQIIKIIGGKPFDESESDSALWADTKTKIQSLLEAESIDQSVADQLMADANDALVLELAPAYQRLIGFLEKDFSNTTELAQGASSLPNGAAYYNYRLGLMTTTDMTADEIHSLGLSEVKRLRAEMELVKVEAAFEGSLQEFFVFQRESKDNDRLYFQDPETGRRARLY